MTFSSAPRAGLSCRSPLFCPDRADWHCSSFATASPADYAASTAMYTAFGAGPAAAFLVSGRTRPPVCTQTRARAISLFIELTLIADAGDTSPQEDYRSRASAGCALRGPGSNGESNNRALSSIPLPFNVITAYRHSPVDCSNGYWSRSLGSSIPSRDSAVIAGVCCTGWAPMRAYACRSGAGCDSPGAGGR